MRGTDGGVLRLYTVLARFLRRSMCPFGAAGRCIFLQDALASLGASAAREH